MDRDKKIILILNERYPATDYVARLHIVGGRLWSAFWIRAPLGIDLLGLFAFGGRLIGRTSDFGSENLGSRPSPQAIWSSANLHRCGALQETIHISLELRPLRRAAPHPLPDEHGADHDISGGEPVAE